MKNKEVEIKIGEIHSEWTGFPVICLDNTDNGGCEDCVFHKDVGYGCCMDYLVCEKWRRSDHKQVIFKRYNSSEILNK